MASSTLARLIRRGGGRLLDRAVATVLPEKPASVGAPRPRHPVIKAITGAAISNFATKSVPGAIIVGGGLLAKALYDRKKARDDSGPDSAGT